MDAAFFHFLTTLQPGWALLMLIAAILSLKSPQLIRELFSGIAKLRRGKH